MHILVSTRGGTSRRGCRSTEFVEWYMKMLSANIHFIRKVRLLERDSSALCLGSSLDERKLGVWFPVSTADSFARCSELLWDPHCHQWVPVGGLPHRGKPQHVEINTRGYECMELHPHALHTLVWYTSTVELRLSGLIWTASHQDMPKIRIIGFFFENGLYWRFAVRLLPFTAFTSV